MDGIGRFGGDFQNLREGFRRERMIKALIDIFEGHAVGKALQDK
jgi:hypothetical protein